VTSIEKAHNRIDQVFLAHRRGELITTEVKEEVLKTFNLLVKDIYQDVFEACHFKTEKVQVPELKECLTKKPVEVISEIMNEEEIDEDWITLIEASRLIGVNYSWISFNIGEGHLKVVGKKGRKKYLSRKQVLEWDSVRLKRK
jgi:hypothetical protein